MTDAADRVLEAFKAKQPLKALAAADQPDPWRVADELSRRGELDAARAFAKAAPRPDTKKLPAYVAGASKRKDEPGARAALAAYRRAYDQKKSPAEQLAALAKVAADRNDVTSAFVHYQRGWGYTDAQDFVKAVASWRRAGDIAKRLGWLSLAEQAFNGAGGQALATGDIKAALACAEAQLEVSTKRGHVTGVVYARNAIGICYRKRGDYDLALKHLQGALAAARQAGMKKFAAMIQLNLVNILATRADYDGAISTGEEARKVFDAIGDEVHMAKIRVELGSAHLLRGDLQRAKRLYEEGYTLLSQLRDPAAAIALVNLAGIEAKLGDIRGAVGKFKALSTAFTRRQDFHRAAQCRSALAKVYVDLADYDQAIVEFQRALEMLQRVGDKKTMAIAHSDLGGARERMGRTDLALAHYETARDLYRKVGAPKGEASVLAARGALYWTIGQDEKGEKLLREARAIYERIGNHGDAAQVAGVLAAVLSGRGRHEDAVRDLEKALAFHRRSRDPAAEARVLYNLGVTYASLKKYKKALRSLEQGIKNYEQLGNLEGKASALSGAAEMHYKLGRPKKAFEMFEESARVAEEIGAQRVLVNSLTSQAWARLHGGSPDQALALARRALESLPDLVRGLSDEEGASARSAYGDVFEVGSAAALERRDAAAASMFLESGRAGSLLEALGGRDSLRGVVIAEDLRIVEAKAEKGVAAAEERSRAALASGKLKRARAARKELAAARAELFDAQNRIRREAKRAANVLYPTVKPLAEIQAALRADDALVVYGIYRRSLALVVMKHGARVVPLSAGKEIEAACAALEVHDREAAYAESLAALRDEVAAPLKLPASVRRVLLSPQGALAYVPAALLFPGKDVAYLPSGTTYLHLREHAAERGVKVLALGDPDYTETDGTGGLRRVGRMKLQPLPATRAEAKTVGTVTLLGEDATEEMLRDTLQKEKQWRAVHFACHGILNAEHPRLSALAVTKGGDDDGLLTVLEVYRMEIPADLVVLSACETGRGKVYKAEGVVGFTRAFMFAGAPRVVVSLWEVDDKATSALMVKFYAVWKKGRSAAGALREAQEFIKGHAKWTHPHFWAAWQLWGLPD
ncbi:MAG: CHAT domain-containing protein [Planctomycetota bacterium]|nr:CHAT domain-containing protein [Planctomycetota bacterium]